MTFVMIYNSQSGSSMPLDELRSLCNDTGVGVDAFIDITTDWKTALSPLLQTNTTVAAISGDGTLSSVANELVGKDVIFAPLPGGTLNHFTKDLGISQDIHEALTNLSKTKPRQIDAARVNGTVFINNSSIGLYPSSLQLREELEDKKIHKWPAAVVASVRAFVKYRTLTVTISGDTFKTPFVFVGNNDYHLETPTAAARESLDQGILSVYAIASTGRWHLAKIVIRTLFGRLSTIDDVKVWKTSALDIHARKDSLKVSRDGELERIKTPLVYEIIPDALTIIGS